MRLAGQTKGLLQCTLCVVTIAVAGAVVLREAAVVLGDAHLGQSADHRGGRRRLRRVRRVLWWG